MQPRLRAAFLPDALSQPAPSSFCARTTRRDRKRTPTEYRSSFADPALALIRACTGRGIYPAQLTVEFNRVTDVDEGAGTAVLGARCYLSEFRAIRNSCPSLTGGRRRPRGRPSRAGAFPVSTATAGGSGRERSRRGGSTAPRVASLETIRARASGTVRRFELQSFTPGLEPQSGRILSSCAERAVCQTAARFMPLPGRACAGRHRTAPSSSITSAGDAIRIRLTACHGHVGRKRLELPVPGLGEREHDSPASRHAAFALLPWAASAPSRVRAMGEAGPKARAYQSSAAREGRLYYGE